MNFCWPRTRAQVAGIEHGFALATCLLLLTIFTLLAIAGFTAALVEWRIATNVEQRERAFEAAEYAIEQALLSPNLAISLTPAAPLAVPAAGAPIAVPGGAGAGFSYRLYFAGSTASGLPPLHPAAGLTAFHFVIEAVGYGAQGANGTHVQSFKVLRPASWIGGPADAACAADDTACVEPPAPRPLRTSWVEAEAE